MRRILRKKIVKGIDKGLQPFLAKKTSSDAVQSGMGLVRELKSGKFNIDPRKVKIIKGR